MQDEILNNHNRMEPFKVLLKIVHDTLKRKPTANNCEVVRMSDLRDDSLFESEDEQRVKITLKYDKPIVAPSHVTLELKGEAQKRLSILVDLQVGSEDEIAPENGTDRPQNQDGTIDGSENGDRNDLAQKTEEASENRTIDGSENGKDSRQEDRSDLAQKTEGASEASALFHSELVKSLKELRRSTDRLSTAQQDEVSKLIHQLIMERFRDELRQIEARISGRRHQAREPENLEEDAKMEYDEKTFLREALGQEDAGFESEGNLLSCYYSTDRSIGSSNVSTLLSSGGSNTIYSAILPKTMRYRSDTLNEYDIYESIDETIVNDESETLIGRIRDEWGVIGQLTNALREYRRRPQVGEGVLVEAERLLLVATYRRDCLTERLCKLDERHDKDRNHVLKTTVQVSDLAFFLRDKPSKREYFTCLLRGGDQVRSTRTVQADTDGSVRFEERFQFEGAATEIDGIELGVYGLVVPKGRKLKTPRLHFAPAVPSFKLRCRTVLRPHSDRLLTEHDSPFCPVFTVTINRAVHIEAHERGFLSIGTFLNGCPVWTRRWCTLDGSTLRYWNHPNEETVARPVGCIDLTGYNIGSEEDWYGRPKTIVLYTKNSTNPRYLLTTDTTEEHNRWKQRLTDVVTCFD